MFNRFSLPLLLLLLLLTSGCLRPLALNGIPDPPPESVPARTILQTENIDLLWVKEIELNDPYNHNLEFFTPGNQSVVFWSQESGQLVAVDAVTGEWLWQTEAPDRTVIRLHDGKFFVTSYQWLDSLLAAPVRDNQVLPDCSFGGKASLSVYDAISGERIWGYGYEGVDGYDIYFQGHSIYLTGSGDHGASRSIVKIDAASGELLGEVCSKWPDKTDIPSPLLGADIPQTGFPVILEEDELKQGTITLDFGIEESRINILNNRTREVLGYIEFDGALLIPWDIDITLQNNVAVIYLNDSNQLFGLRY